MSMSIKPNIIRDINLDWLQKTASEISKGNTALNKKCKNAQFVIKNSIMIRYPISENSLRRLFRFHHIEYHAKKGPEEKEIPPEVEINIVSYNANNFSINESCK